MTLAKPGDAVAGKYLVRRVIGEGGMGLVVEAVHVPLDQRVAIKFLLPESAAQPAMVARFAREARAMTRLRCEHVARILDVGESDAYGPYLVMEYLDGMDVGTWLQLRGCLPLELAVDVLLQACAAVAEAHTLGIVHRDLKPGNLFLSHAPDGTGCIKVLDFGISKLTVALGTGTDPTLTGTETMLGSPIYMSPEQLMSSRDVDARADLWSLGAILFELLTCVQPFRAPTFPQICQLVLHAPTPSLRPLRPDVPQEVDVLIARCLEKSPERRPATTLDFATELAPFGGEQAQARLQRVRGIVHNTPKPASAVSGAPSMGVGTIPSGMQSLPNALSNQPRWPQLDAPSAPRLVGDPSRAAPPQKPMETPSFKPIGQTIPPPKDPRALVATAAVLALLVFAVPTTWLALRGQQHRSRGPANAPLREAAATLPTETSTADAPFVVPNPEPPSAWPAAPAATPTPMPTAMTSSPPRAARTFGSPPRAAAPKPPPAPQPSDSARPTTNGDELFDGRK